MPYPVGAYAAGLCLVLAALWGLLSGHTEPLILAFGLVSILAVVLANHALGILDREAVPLELAWRGLRYWFWLLWEIVKANIDVARIILSPRLPVSPTLLDVDSHQDSELGDAIHANSITLTPGTISVHLQDGKITVHALTGAGADGVAEGTFARKAHWLESGK